MVQWFGEATGSEVGRLELLARALGQAHAQHRAEENTGDVRPLVAEAVRVRTALLAEVHSLAARDFFAARSLGPLHGGSGFKNLGFDVLQLVAFLTQHWDAIEHATGLEYAELERSEALANQLITTAAVRSQRTRLATADIRQRAFSLLVETYDRVRRMLSFIRWNEGDVGEIAPSLFRVGRRGRRGGGVVAAERPMPASEGDEETPPRAQP